MAFAPPIVLHLGLMPYAQAMNIMNTCHERVVHDQDHPGYILCVQHTPTITFGQRLVESDLLQSREFLEKQGVQLVLTDRGGRITVHEPGQLVVYPIIRLNSKKLGVKSFVFLLEESIIRTLNYFNLAATRHAEHPGVWMGNQKIAALGLRISSQVSKHGFALNVHNTLSTFKATVPCGISNAGVRAMGQEFNMDEVNKKLLANLLELLFLAAK